MEVGVRELRNNLSRYLDRMRDGEEVVVTDRGHAIARVLPLGTERVLEHEAEAPAFVWLECLSELVPCQSATVDNDVVRTTVLTLAAPDESAFDVVVS